MQTNRLSKGIAALSLLLLVGAGCGTASETSLNASAGAAGLGNANIPAGDGIEANVNGSVKVNLEANGATGARREVEPAPALDEAGSREIKVTATNWAFEPTEIRAKEGEKIKLTLVNSDGIHGIAIPAFNVSLKPATGTTGSTVFIADKKGTYPFFCNVRCGEGHKSMKGTLIVE